MQQIGGLTGAVIKRVRMPVPTQSILEVSVGLSADLAPVAKRFAF